MVRENTKNIKVTDNDDIKTTKIIQPIICEGDVIGAVAMVAKEDNDKMTETDVKIVSVAASFLGKQMES